MEEIKQITSLVDIHGAWIETKISNEMIRELKKLGYLVIKNTDNFVITKKIKRISISKNSHNSPSGRVILNKSNLEHLGSKQYVIIEVSKNRLLIVPLENKPIL